MTLDISRRHISRPHISATFAVIALVGALLSACGTARVTTKDTPIRQRFPQVEAECQQVALHGRLRTVNALFDSTRLMSRLASVTPNRSYDELVSVRMGIPPEVHIVGAPFDEPRDSIGDAARSSLRSIIASTPIAFRLHAKRSRTVEVSIEKSVLCEPTHISFDSTRLKPNNGFTVGSASGFVLDHPVNKYPSDTLDRTTTESSRYRVNRDGTVSDFEIIHTTGSIKSDQALKDKFTARHHSPALLDGWPADVWLTGRKVELAK